MPESAQQNDLSCKAPSEGEAGRTPRRIGDLVRDEGGATTLEYALLIAAIILPSYYIIHLATDALVGHYQMMTMLNSLPFP